MKMLQCVRLLVVCLLATCLFPCLSSAEDLKVGDTAPLFSLPNQEGKLINLESRKSVGWTVLYFYPKSETPGCTQQACAFRDSIDKIRLLGAEVYGISADTVQAQKGFHENHKLKFDLLADPELKVIGMYKTKMPALSFSRRWTFIIDPELKIRGIEHNVDPMMDAQRVADELLKFQSY